VHAPPPAPHAAVLEPAWQAPPAQQPPLQAVSPVLPHAVPQRWVERSHAVSAAQSAARLQPHAPARQTWPAGETVQSAQLAPQA
jgi:hypothetical protein